MSRPKFDCPKCASPNAWLHYTETDKVLRCLCGLYKILETKLQDIVIEHNVLSEDVKLPRRNTNIWHTMMVMTTTDIANSAEIAGMLRLRGHEFTVSDVSSYLTMLRAKGLVVQLDSKRGVAGGSRWQLTKACLILIQGKPQE